MKFLRELKLQSGGRKNVLPHPTEPGNSGSPVYVLTDSQNREVTTEVGSDIDIDGGSWKYVSSLYGGYVMKDGRDFSVYTQPYLFHDDYFQLLQ